MARNPPRLGRDKTLDDMATQRNVANEADPTHGEDFEANRDPGLRHVDQMEGNVDDDDAGLVEGDTGDETDSRSEQSDDEDDPVVRVEVLGAGHFYNNHPLSIGHVIELPASEVDLLRERGYRLGPVDADDERTPYDHTTEWQHPGNEKADKQEA